ncbi:MAG: choice-of-anchor tandem repeat GloVer-containing protein [Bacteroidota bacterium]
MKSITIFLRTIILGVMFFSPFTSIAQQRLWGTTEHGGTDGIGSVYTVYLGDHTPFESVSFQAIHPGMAPNGSLILGSDSLLYGIAGGGENHGGLIYRVSLDGGTYEILHEFAYDSGRDPSGSSGLFLASDGKMYGLAREGGTSDVGVLFSIDPAQAGSYTVEQAFGTTLGAFPIGSLIETNGKLYGVTELGSSQSNGTVLFSWSLANQTSETVANFSTSTGNNPQSGLTLASNDYFYGIARTGGTHNFGTIYKMHRDSNLIHPVYSFPSNHVFAIHHTPMIEDNGQLYGVTSTGGMGNRGTLFSINLASDSFSFLINFGDVGLKSPWGGLLVDNGILYGTTFRDDGFLKEGVLYGYAINSDTVAILHTFGQDQSGGKSPFGGLTLVGDRLYGSTKDGGTGSFGTLFSFDLGTGTHQKLLDFSHAPDGAIPVGTLVETPDGLLYGMAQLGGPQGYGGIFSFDQHTSDLTLRAAFSEETGRIRDESLVLGQDGWLYGVQQLGGVNNWGVIIRFDPATDSLEVLHKFQGSPDGLTPMSNLVQHADGNFYGMTNSGGDSSLGTIFRWDPVQQSYGKVFSMGASMGGNTAGGLVAAQDGKLYGSTSFGGQNGFGSLFSFNPVDSSFTPLYFFESSLQFAIKGTMIEAQPGILTGLSFNAGSFGRGTLYGYDVAQDSFFFWHEFDPAIASNPLGEVILAEGDQVYGISQNGSGEPSSGALFRFDPTGGGSFQVEADIPESFGGKLLSHLFVTGFPTPIDGPILPLALQVFPNPTRERLQFSFQPLQGSKRIACSLLDISGKTLIHQSKDPTGSIIEETWDLSSFASGIYFLRIRVDEFVVSQKVWIP